MSNEALNVESILGNLKIQTLNEMQKASIEAVNRNDEVILLSATGSGKTLAYLLPVIPGLDANAKETQAIIIVPSRELALQIEHVFKSMKTGLKVTCCYGGHLRETEENNLKQPPALLIGTPGRLADHIRRNNITTSSITTLVLDEFDKSLELGFLEEMSFIIGSLPSLRKKILTSATEAVGIPEFVGLKHPVKLNFLSVSDATGASLEVMTVMSPEKDKLDTLLKLICFLGNRSMIIFCNHRDAVQRTSEFLADKGVVNEYYHGALEQQQRDSALFKFRNGSTDVLVTTDLASRGLDIPNIRYIIHYHLPLSEDAYTHRNGRTARMEASGTAILILSPEESIPPYIDSSIEQLEIPESYSLPDKPKWATFFVAAGKKDKVNKVDIVGFLSNKGQLKKEDIGLIEVKDFFSFVAVRKSKASHTLQLIKNERIKNKKVKIEIAK